MYINLLKKLMLLLLVTIYRIPAAQAGVVCEAQNGTQCLYTSPGATGTGSFQSPASMQQVLSLAAAGDYVYLLEGNYTNHYNFGGQDAIINL